MNGNTSLSISYKWNPNVIIIVWSTWIVCQRFFMKLITSRQSDRWDSLTMIVPKVPASVSLSGPTNSKVDWTLILLLSEFFFINSAAINTESFLFIPKTGNASPISAVLERTHPFYKRLHGNPLKVNDFFTPLVYHECASLFFNNDS